MPKIFACNGILFNHESPRRGETFVTKKIISGLCRIKLGCQKLCLQETCGKENDAKKTAMWQMIMTPNDYVIATGKQYSVKQFVNFTLDELK